MSAFERKSSVSKFVKRWSNRGYEKGKAQPFWLSLLRDVFNIAEPENFIRFEVPIPRDLRDAHKKNDLAVAKAYGFEKILDDEPKIVAELIKLYKKLTGGIIHEA